MMETPYEKGINDYRNGICVLPMDVMFFQLKTYEERQYWTGWTYARGHEKYLKEKEEENGTRIR